MCAVGQISDVSNAAYSSTDLLLRATFNQDSVWEDLSVTQQAYRQQVSSNLQTYGWNMVGMMMHHPASALLLMPSCDHKHRLRVWHDGVQTAVLPMGITITSEAAQVLTLMPIPGYSSHKVVLQV